MSYNGSGTFNINSSGQPVVTGTVISSTAFNALTADLGTGLSTAITKDGQTVATQRIPFAAGINSSLVTDATNTTTGSIITAGGIGVAKALFVGTTANIAGTTTLAGVTATTLGVTGISTMAAINASGTVAMAGAATVGTTLGVTGATTLGVTGANFPGSTSGTATLKAAAAAGTPTLTLPTTTDTLVGQATVDTLTNKTLVAPALGTPVSGDLTNCTGFPGRNALINGGFTLNQRAYVSGATLASTVYGHDRWKAGSGGGDYSFTQLNSDTTITIASGKTLIQVVEDKNVQSTSYVLSWTGTAQARYAVNSATPTGSYAASPILITGQTAGTTMSVEFNAGILEFPQLEVGAVATAFEIRSVGTELALCQRYFEKSADAMLALKTTAGAVYTRDGTASSVSRYYYTSYKVAKRTTATITFYDTNFTTGKCTVDSTANITANAFNYNSNSFGMYASTSISHYGVFYGWYVDAEL